MIKNQIRPRNILHYQKGAGLWGILFSLLVLVFAAYTVMMIGGSYVDNRMVNGTLQKMGNEPRLLNQSKFAIKNLLFVKLRSTGVRINDDEVFVEKQSNNIIIDIDYERRIHIVSNLDVVLTFENRFELK